MNGCHFVDVAYISTEISVQVANKWEDKYAIAVMYRWGEPEE